MDQLQRNEIYPMDCLDGLPGIPTGSVKLIVADPPYFLGMTHNGQRGSFVDLAICKPFYKLLFAEYKRILRPDGEVYFFTDWRGYAFYYPLFDAILGCQNLIVWDKKNGPGTLYKFCHEFIMWHTVDPKVIKRESNVWRSAGFGAGARSTNGDKVIQTQKTIEIIEKIVGDNSAPGDLIVDTFGGSGTTAVACRKLGRDYIVFELDEANFDNAVKRAELSSQSTFFQQQREQQKPTT